MVAKMVTEEEGKERRRNGAEERGDERGGGDGDGDEDDGGVGRGRDLDAAGADGAS